MGVSAETYLIAGVALGKPEDACNHPAFKDVRQSSGWDTLESLESKLDVHLTLIVDGMNGEYAYAGVVLARSSQEEGFDPPFTFDPFDLDAAKRLIEQSPLASLAAETKFHRILREETPPLVGGEESS
jgi:hypothetical protein